MIVCFLHFRLNREYVVRMVSYCTIGILPGHHGAWDERDGIHGSFHDMNRAAVLRLATVLRQRPFRRSAVFDRSLSSEYHFGEPVYYLPAWSLVEFLHSLKNNRGGQSMSILLRAASDYSSWPLHDTEIRLYGLLDLQWSSLMKTRTWPQLDSSAWNFRLGSYYPTRRLLW
jgi:hypothetical protein